MDAHLVLGVAPLAVLSTYLLVLTAIDLANRDSVEVAGGSKIVWCIALLVMPAGSIVYLWFGRKRTPRS